MPDKMQMGYKELMRAKIMKMLKDQIMYMGLNSYLGLAE